MSNKLAKRSVASGPVEYQVHGPTDHPTGLTLSMNYEEAPVPDHYYVASWFDIAERDLEVVMSFGDLDTTGKLRSRIDITFPAFLFIQQLWRSSRDFHKNLTKVVTALGLKARETVAAEQYTDKLQTLASNNVLMVLSGTECLADFFYISPKDMWSKPRRGEQLNLEPVVRVLLSPTLLLGLMNAAEPIAAHISERFATQLRMEEHLENMESQHAR